MLVGKDRGGSGKKLTTFVFSLIRLGIKMSY